MLDENGSTCLLPSLPREYRAVCACFHISTMCLSPFFNSLIQSLRHTVSQIAVPSGKIGRIDKTLQSNIIVAAGPKNSESQIFSGGRKSTQGREFRYTFNTLRSPSFFQKRFSIMYWTKFWKRNASASTASKCKRSESLVRGLRTWRHGLYVRSNLWLDY